MTPWGAKRARLKGTGPASSWSEGDLRPDLGYVWQLPAAPIPVNPGTFDEIPAEDVVAEMVTELVDREWRVADLRYAIETLGVQAKGRTRKALAEQLAAVFLDEARLARAVAGLSEEDRNAYALLLLQDKLHYYYSVPDTRTLWQEYTSSRTGSQVADVLLKSHLLLQTDDGELYAPYALFRRLPVLSLPVPTTKQPAKIVPAADPHTMLGQIQQLLALLQTDTSALRPRLRWRAPKYPYAQPVVCWPPVPADAESLNANFERERVLALLPPQPYLDEPSLQSWSSKLDVPTEWAEFYFHLLLAAGLIQPGSPVLVNEALAHEWMSLAPGRQVCAALTAYRDIRLWAIWWSHWRSGELHVRRSYHGYWGLNSMDETVEMACTHLRWVVLEFLSFLPQNVWLDMKVVGTLLARLYPTADTHRFLMGLTLERVQGGWPAFLQTTLLEILMGPLRAMGFVEAGPSLDDVRAIRLVGFQDVLWGRVREVPLEASGELSRKAIRLVLAGRSRSATPDAGAPPHPAEGAILEVQSPVPPAFTTFVLRWAGPAGFSKNLVRYELDVQRLHRTFEDGDSPDVLSESWEATVGFAPLPQIVEWWQFWWDRYGRVRLYPPQALLQTRDAFTLQEVQAALPQLQGSILGIVTPCAALLEPDDVDKILSALMRQGYMPKESS